MSFRSKLHSVGYDQEEAYFHQKNTELIQKLKQNQNNKGHLKMVKNESKEQSSAPARPSKKAA